MSNGDMEDLKAKAQDLVGRCHQYLGIIEKLNDRLQDLVNRAAVYKNALEYYENLSYSCSDMDLGGQFYEGEIAKIALSEGSPKDLMAKIEAEIVRKSVEY